MCGRDKRETSAEVNPEARGTKTKPGTSSDKQVYEDIFIKNSVFPDPLSLFEFKPSELQTVKRECVFVLDTNILLLPYELNSPNFQSIKDVYSLLKTRDQLVVPGQVAREFVRHRPDKLLAILSELNDLKSKIPELEGKSDSLPSYPPPYSTRPRSSRPIASHLAGRKQKFERWMNIGRSVRRQ